MYLFDVISSSALARAFGWTLFHSLWQGFIWVLALSLFLRFISRQKAQLRYVASLLCLLGLFASSLGTFLYEYQLISHASLELSLGSEATITVTSPALQEVANPGIFERLTISIENWGAYLPYFTMIWALGVLFFSIKWLGSWVYLQDIRKNSTDARYKWQSWVDELAYEMNIHRYVSLRESSQIQSPMVIGHLKPMILLPIGMLTNLSTTQLEAILAHELAHIRRYDFLINLIQSVMEIIFFYHPAQWWISNQVRDEREHCCDDSAVSVCGDPMAYAKALADLEEMRIQQLQLAPALSGRKPHLLTRIKRLLSPELVEKPRETRVYVMSLLMLALCATFMINPGYAQDKVEHIVEGVLAVISEEECEEEIPVLAPLAAIAEVEIPALAPSVEVPLRFSPEPSMLAPITQIPVLDQSLSFINLIVVSDTPPPAPPMPPVPPVPPVPDMSGMPMPPSPPTPPTPAIAPFDSEDSVAMKKFELQMEKFGKEMEVWGEKYGELMEDYGKKMEVWSKSMETDWGKWEKEFEKDYKAWEEKYGKDWEKWGKEYEKKWKEWEKKHEEEYEDMDEEERAELREEIRQLREEQVRARVAERQQLRAEQAAIREQLRAQREEARAQQVEVEEVKRAAEQRVQELQQQRRELERETQMRMRDAEIARREAEREAFQAMREKERALTDKNNSAKGRKIIITQLVKDGLLAEGAKKIYVHIDGEGMVVNKKEMSEEVYQKYLKLLQKNGFNIRQGKANGFRIKETKTLKSAGSWESDEKD